LDVGLQTQSNTHPVYNGPYDAIKKIYSAHGIAGIYKGQAVTFLREAVGYGVYFLTYEKLMQREMEQKGIPRYQIKPINAVLYGAIAGYAVRLFYRISRYYPSLAYLLLSALGCYISNRHDQIQDADRRIHSIYRTKIHLYH
jgi:Mitochondrial carrier protein